MDLGFDALGFSKTLRLDYLEQPILEWLEKGYQGQMSWLANNLEKRLNPNELFPGAKTMISLVSCYHTDAYEAECGISRYAVGRDYHKVLKKKGQALVEYIQEVAGDVQARVFVDSAPVLEREWARRGGLGWIGKNGCLIVPKKGSWFFLSEIILDLDLPPDPIQEMNYCGSCTRCIQACPTQALLGNGLLDASRCISYQTIELKEAIAISDNPPWENWIFGCDICQEVCPWNRTPVSFKLEDFSPRRVVMDLKNDLRKGLSDEELERRISGTPLKRAGAAKLRSNLEFINDPTGQKDFG